VAVVRDGGYDGVARAMIAVIVKSSREAVM